MPRAKIPSRLIKSVEACPPVVGRVRREKVMAMLKGGKLTEVAAKYAEKAADHGSDGDYWKVWWEIQGTRKLSLDESIDEIDGQQRRWFARWCLEHGEDSHGTVAYRRYLDDPEGPGPFENENTLYLDALIRTDRSEEVLSTVHELEEKAGQLGWERTRAAQVQYARGKTRSAQKVLDDLIEEHDDDPQLHGQIALVYCRVGKASKGKEILERALPQGIFYEPLVDELREAFSISEEEWEALSEGREGRLDFEQLARHWWLDPGARLQASERPAPHWFGGEDFKMPKCKGCKHPIRQWFLLDIREIKGLAAQLPSWTVMPMLGCADCMVWMGRHDYTVDLDRMQIKLNKVTLNRIKDFSKPFGEYEATGRHFVRLERLKPKKRPRAANIEQYCEIGPLVGGAPPWYQDPTEMKCPTCKTDMVYVAALSSINDFGASIPINNESGYQYHFACDKCLSLSVLAQWS